MTTIIEFPGKKGPINFIEQIKTRQDAIKYIIGYFENLESTAIAMKGHDIKPEELEGFKKLNEALEVLRGIKLKD